MHTNPAAEQNKSINTGPRVRGISRVGKEKSLWRKGFEKFDRRFDKQVVETSLIRTFVRSR